jgi:parallel beta-helix repeat protein
MIPRHCTSLLPIAAAVLVSARVPAASAASEVQPVAAFYVAPDGNDAWSGTLAAPNADGSDGPFATPARARDAARERRAKQPAKGPLTVLIRGGRYELAEPLTFTPADSGTADSPTFFAAYPGERPVFSGGKRISGWTPAARGIWIAALPKANGPWRCRWLLVNGEIRHRPRLPKQGFYTIAGLAGADPKGRYDVPANRFEFKKGEVRPDWKNIAEVEFVVLHFWVDAHLKITAVDTGRNIVVFDRFSPLPFIEDPQNRLARYYLTNVAEALTEAGEFYIDNPTGVVYYLPKQGEDLAKAEVVAPRLDCLIRFAGDPQAMRFVEYVELRGLSVSDSTWEPLAKDGVYTQAAATVPGAIQLRGARHCSINDCRLINLTGYGIELADGCRDNHIIGNELAHLGAGGIKVSGGGPDSPEAYRTGSNVITDNELHHLGEVFHCGVGVLVMHADSNSIAHNHIHHLYYTGVSCGWVWGYGPNVSRDNRIEFNHIHDIGQRLLSDMGGVYLLGKQPGTVVRGNVIHDVDSWSYGGWGIYADEGSSDILIENNLVYRTRSGGFHQHYGKDNVVRNNIFALAREEQISRSRAEPHKSFSFEHNIVYFREGALFGKNWTGAGFALDSNLYWNAAGKPVTFPGGSAQQWVRRGFDRHSLIADPKFRDPDKGDFALVEDSPALKLGFKPFDVASAGPRPPAQRR